jgi:hypothetical protein
MAEASERPDRRDLRDVGGPSRAGAIYSRVELIEYDLRTRSFVRRLRSRELLQGVTYVPRGLVITRSFSSGNLWIGELAR